jgi:hypothetical protein
LCYVLFSDYAMGPDSKAYVIEYNLFIMAELQDFFTLEPLTSGDTLAQRYYTACFDQIKTATNHKAVYDNLFDFILNILKPGHADNVYAKYIQNSDIGFLERTAIKDANHSGFQIGASGITALEKRIAANKKRIYNYWVTAAGYALGDDGVLAIEDTDTLDAINTKITFLLNKIKAKYPVISKVDTARSKMTKAAIVDELFDGPIMSKEALRDIFKLTLEQTRLANSKKASNPANRQRAKNIFETLKIAFGVSDADIRKEVTYAPNTLTQWPNMSSNLSLYNQFATFVGAKITADYPANKDNLKSLLNNTYLTFSDLEILKESLRKFVKNENTKWGISQLEQAVAIGFSARYEMKRQVENLKNETDSLLETLVLKYKVRVPGPSGQPDLFDKVSLFPFTHWDDIYQRTFQVIDNTVTSVETLDLYNRPLVRYFNQGIMFLNLSSLFYFYPPDSDKIAYKVSGAWNAPVLERRIDFLNRKIYDQAGSAITFSDFRATIQQGWARTTQKGFFSLRYEWRALYAIELTNEISTHLIWSVGYGGGHGIGRADNVEKGEYLWGVNVKPSDPSYATDEPLAKNLGIILGLAVDRYQNLTENVAIASNGYAVRTVRYAGDEYVRVHLYNEHIMGMINNYYMDASEKTQLPQDYHRYFNLCYYRKVKEDTVKNMLYVTKKDRKNYPVSPNENELAQMSLPINFNDRYNIGQFQQEINGRLRKSNGGTLGVNPNLRQNAGTVMTDGAFVNLYEADVRMLINASSSLPADYFSQIILNRLDSMALPDWQNLKDTEGAAFPTSQEWCHLFGHGDGGNEVVANFVSGSAHCNTEQLAIELGQRVTTQSKDKPAGVSYTLLSTAYLFKDNSIQTALPAAVPAPVPAPTGGGVPPQKPSLKRNMTVLMDNHSAKYMRRSETNLDPRIFKPVPVGEGAPIAAYIRYIVYKEEGATRTKMFEHIFEGQSEFFDKNQYNLLHYMIRFALAPDKFAAWYKEKNDALQADGGV